MNSSTD